MVIIACLLLAFGCWGILACEVAEARFRTSLPWAWYAPAFTVVGIWVMVVFRLATSEHTRTEALLIDGIALPLLSLCAFSLTRACLRETRRSGISRP